jgi:hypothetical protein
VCNWFCWCTRVQSVAGLSGATGSAGAQGIQRCCWIKRSNWSTRCCWG